MSGEKRGNFRRKKTARVASESTPSMRKKKKGRRKDRRSLLHLQMGEK